MNTKKQLQQANDTKFILQNTNYDVINSFITNFAKALMDNTEEILKENKKDLKRMVKSNPKYDRLLLNEKRMFAMANDVIKIANYNFQTHKILEKRTGENGIEIEKVSCPMGVVGMIYESRPNVTVDAICLCIKTRNVCILKGSSDSRFTNEILVKIAHDVLKYFGLPQNIITLLNSSREDTLELITAKGLVDLCIPRGGKNLIEFVTQNTKVPVIETGAGVVHIFIDDDFNIEIAKKVILNSKTRRPSVCNSLDCIVITKKSLKNIEEIIKPLLKADVEILCDDNSFRILKNSHKNIKLAKNEDFGTEFLAMKLSIKTVENINEAIDFINAKSSKHTECIITNSTENAQIFLKSIDSAVVLHNIATSFTDGGCFGMISEIGISTQKIHARGPFALEELLTYKWIIKSSGAIRL